MLLKGFLLILLGLRGSESLGGSLLGSVTNALPGANTLTGALPGALPAGGNPLGSVTNMVGALPVVGSVLPGAPPPAGAAPPVGAAPPAGATPPAGGTLPAAGTPPVAGTPPAPLSPTQVVAVNSIATQFLNLVFPFLQSLSQIISNLKSGVPAASSPIQQTPAPPRQQSDLPINAGVGTVAAGRKRRNEDENQRDLNTLMVLLSSATRAMNSKNLDCLLQQMCKIYKIIWRLLNQIFKVEPKAQVWMNQLLAVQKKMEAIKITALNLNEDCSNYSCPYQL